MAQKKQTDREYEKLRGNVESVISFITTNISMDEEISTRTHINSITQIFNKQGNFKQEGKFLDLEQVYMDEMYTYDTQYRLTKHQSFWTKMNHRQEKRYTYEVKKIIERVYKNDSYYAKYVSELDTDGNVIKKTSFNLSGVKVRTVFYTYKNENLIQEKSVDHLKKRTASKQNTYDAKGNLIKAKGFYNGSPSYEIFFIYNEQGDVIEQKRVTGNEISKMTYSYKYDAQNNFIECEEVDVDNQMRRITKRKVTYYE